MKALLEAGVHFGHQTRRWNPKMSKYIFGARNNIHIIDLQKTVKELKHAYKFVRDLSSEGKKMLFVGTKKQAQEIIQQEAIRCGAYYVNQRWLGGTLTNFETIKKSIARLGELNRMKADGIYKVLSKKESARWEKERLRLERMLSGIKEMEQLPGVVYLIDPRYEATAVAEAKKMQIPVIAICDTDADPEVVDYPIPGNDDALRAIRLFTGIIADALVEGKELFTQKTEKEVTTEKGELVFEATIPEEELLREEPLGETSQENPESKESQEGEKS
jgi:small subunit ribosomal protein S2